MTGEWQEVTLGKVAEILMGQSPPGSTYNERMEGLPFFQGIADFGYRHPVPRVYCTAPTRIAQLGDILLSVRAPIGKINIANRECAIGRGLSIIRARDPKEARYIEFALRNMENFWNTIEGGGSVFGNATKDDLERLSIPWPENRSERRAIAHILGTLDDKIELNRRMSQTLEEMARALFKAWFVDFEPVRAKMQGRWRRGESLPGLPAHLYDLFPDRLVDSQLGEIPEGWEVRMLGELLELAYGKALKADNRQHGTIPVYGSNGQVGWHDEKLVTGPGIIVGRKGNPGVVKWVPTDFFPIDTTFYVIPKDKCPSLHFLFYALDLQNLASLGADSAVPGLNRNLVYMNNQIVPSHTLLLTFDSSVKTIFQKISIVESESRTLAALRDALLPKLVRGELRVKDAEKFLKERGL
jgi:type I restriction enzyme S subunit